MKIAIHAADLDDERIDGTRVYILKMLEYFGNISSEDEFLIYHKSDFNPELTPPDFSNYSISKKNYPFLWTQTRFAWEVFRDNPDVLWMPVHNIPFLRRGKMKTVVTIHDLAFKIFPEYFPKKDLKKLNFLAGLSIRNSHKIIAISEATKKDILKFYPEISEEKIKVIHHGFDGEMFFEKVQEKEMEKVLKKFSLFDSQISNPKSQYLLYVGAIQPRKDLVTLVKAFEIFKKKTNSDIKLVLAGGKAWMWEKTIEVVEKSEFRSDIVLTGKVSFSELVVLYQNAELFVFPEMYAGFGIPILEAFACGVSVITARNSSLIEVGGDAAQFFKTSDSIDLSEKIEKVLGSEELQTSMIQKGLTHLKNFSWEKCAKETLDVIKN
ncbi:MAG: glycosyltransferase family 4 protein [Candidatus Moranbacteria bacterium]|nr:glycosyltransferase family 4 protein [Candidatus Moranbacteria bacterium]